MKLAWVLGGSLLLIATGAVEMPHPRAGLWVTTSVMNGGPAHVTKSCYRGEPMAPPRAPRGQCSQMRIGRTPLGGYVVDAACQNPAGSMVMHVVYSGDFRTSYAADSRMMMNFGGRSLAMNGHVAGHWAGPC